MSRSLSNTTAYVEVDGREYSLGPDRDLVEVMTRIEAVARSEPAFIDLSNGDRMVSVLVSPRSHVVVTVRRNDPPPAATASSEEWSLGLPHFDWD